LPGSPSWSQTGCPDINRIAQQAVTAAKTYQKLGYTGLIIENFGDAPFYPDQVPPETVAAMSIIGHQIRSTIKLPLGINVLRNDAFAALALARVVGANFIRVNILNGVSATDQGLISGQAHTLLRERERLGAGLGGAHPIQIFADVHVKHARPLAERNLEIAAKDLAARGGADALIVSGSRTGSPVSIADLDVVRKAVSCPVLIGSGLTEQNAGDLLPHCHGAIVASATLKGGQPGQDVDPKRAKAVIKASKIKA
ncbi:MAG: BtpA/SgcQ family protein, partial [Planctomycetota bacterium]|nr:BtpA/SgcQ family protein [Planctomycetota bacterium]